MIRYANWFRVDSYYRLTCCNYGVTDQNAHLDYLCIYVSITIARISCAGSVLVVLVVSSLWPV